MRKNIFDAAAQNEIFRMIDSLKKDAQAQWGKMNAHEMLVHCADALRVSQGKREAKRRDNILLRTIVKWMILNRVAGFPKGRTQTFPEIAQDKGGTPPEVFERDKEELKNQLREMLKRGEKGKYERHPMFGRMSGTDWGKLTYIHLRYHLEQFGIQQ